MSNEKDVLSQQSYEYADTILSFVGNEIIFTVLNALFASFLALILAIVVLIVLTKKRLFRRGNAIWNLLAKLHYPIWLAVFICTGFTYGAVNSVESGVVNLMEKTAKPFIGHNVAVLYTYLLNELPLSSSDKKMTVKDATAYISGHISNSPPPELQEESVRSYSASVIALSISDWVVESAVTALVSEATEGVGSALSLNDKDVEFTQEQLLRMDFVRGEDVIVELVYASIEKQFRLFMGGVKANIFIIFAMTIFLLLLEPLVYFILRRKFSKGARVESLAKISI